MDFRSTPCVLLANFLLNHGIIVSIIHSCSPIYLIHQVSHLSPNSQTSPGLYGYTISRIVLNRYQLQTPPTPPPPPLPITRQRLANLRQNPRQRVPYNPFANHATIVPTTITEPTSFTVTNNSPEWRQAMKEEYDALIKNGNHWSLVPCAISTTQCVDGLSGYAELKGINELCYHSFPMLRFVASQRLSATPGFSTKFSSEAMSGSVGQPIQECSNGRSEFSLMGLLAAKPPATAVPKFREVTELKSVSNIKIEGRINTKDLSPKTTYGAYLIIKVSGHASEISETELGKLCFVNSKASSSPDSRNNRRANVGQEQNERRARKTTMAVLVTSKGVPKDSFSKSFEFNAEHYAIFVAHPAPFHKYPELFLCLVGINRYYTLDGDTYPEFLRNGDEEMDLLSFIRTADPIKRTDGEPRLLETTVGRVVLLLPVAPARSFGELEASVDKLFGEGGGGEQVEQGDFAGGGQGIDIQPVILAADTIVEDVAPLQPMRQKKRKNVVVDASSRPSHPPKEN
ncbi:gypsy type transposase [Tanacetum coccineum]